jgi:hypothetical protein
VIRQSVIAAALAGAVVLTAARSAGGATAAGHSTTPAAAAASRPLMRYVPRVTLSGAALAAAANRCAAWAAAGGFPNDGYLAGSLTTAVAIALAESGCDPSACHDNTTGKACVKPVPPGDNIDRGAWQLNNKVPGATSDQCAFNGPCSAKARAGGHDHGLEATEPGWNGKESTPMPPGPRSAVTPAPDATRLRCGRGVGAG